MNPKKNEKLFVKKSKLAKSIKNCQYSKLISRITIEEVILKIYQKKLTDADKVQFPNSILHFIHLYALFTI